jgi:hypothetical protein
LKTPAQACAGVCIPNDLLRLHLVAGQAREITAI